MRGDFSESQAACAAVFPTRIGAPKETLSFWIEFLWWLDESGNSVQFYVGLRLGIWYIQSGSRSFIDKELLFTFGAMYGGWREIKRL